MASTVLSRMHSEYGKEYAKKCGNCCNYRKRDAASLTAKCFAETGVLTEQLANFTTGHSQRFARNG